MWQLQLFVLICLVFSATSTTVTTRLFVPPVVCPEYFRYLAYKNGYVGKITLRDVPFGTLNVEVTFSQVQTVETIVTGRLAFEHDLLMVQKDMENGSPITFKATFPLPTEVPMLIRIKMNDEDICTTDSPPEHKLIFTMRRSFTPTKGTHRIAKVTQTIATSVPAFNPFFNETTPKTIVVTTATTTSAPTTTETSKQILNDPVCGLSSQQTTPLTTSGSVPERGRYPWLVGIYRKKLGGLQYFSSGSLISPRTVITSAVALSLFNIRPNQILASLGRYSLDDFSAADIETRNVQQVVFHPNFIMQESAPSSDSDVALVQLNSSVSYSDYIRPICLWGQSSDAEQIVHETGYVVDWITTRNESNLPSIPYVIRTGIISSSECETLLGDIYKDVFSSRTFCGISRDGGTPCRGNGGSGLAVQRNGRYFLRGIVSSGNQNPSRGCEISTIVVFCDVAKHISWIDSERLY